MFRRIRGCYFPLDLQADLQDNERKLIENDHECAAKLTAALGSCPDQKEAAKNTMAYGILAAHNTSGNMEKLKIKFDKLTSHDITFVGIIQTARASGLEKFPVPYVLTNCHNSLCAVGGTINEDDHMFWDRTAIPATALWEPWPWAKADRSWSSSF